MRSGLIDPSKVSSSYVLGNFNNHDLVIDWLFNMVLFSSLEFVQVLAKTKINCEYYMKLKNVDGSIH